MPKLSITPAARKMAAASCSQAVQLVRACGNVRLWRSSSRHGVGFHITNGAQPMLVRIQSLDAAMACFKSISEGVAHV